MSTIATAASALKDLINAIPEAESIFERAALYGAIKAITNGLLAQDLEIVNGYAKEKARKVCWHAGAALGFDETNGHSVEQHCSWAVGELWSLRDSDPRRGD
ncbi:hypothetical protein [uncultured Pseudomonas sp.]|uniref:hypothetical protein n=1 Tax=uncultured Pseudomonas sp. TaxID=114707 RepID=UPI0025DC43F0|nr:hypothetical protein [uncultured Pseudomonas sp.]